MDQAISGRNHRSSAVRSAGETGLAAKKEKGDSDDDDVEKGDEKDGSSDEDESS